MYPGMDNEQSLDFSLRTWCKPVVDRDPYHPCLHASGLQEKGNWLQIFRKQMVHIVGKPFAVLLHILHYFLPIRTSVHKLSQGTVTCAIWRSPKKV